MATTPRLRAAQQSAVRRLRAEARELADASSNLDDVDLARKCRRRAILSDHEAEALARDLATPISR